MHAGLPSCPPTSCHVAGNVCALFTAAPSGLVPYTFITPVTDTCACFSACRAEYACNARVFCPGETARKDCRASPVTLDSLASNPCQASSQ